MTCQYIEDDVALYFALALPPLMSSYNPNHHSVKRILREVKEFQRENDPDIMAAPLDGDLFEWHFTLRGPPDSSFQDGIYHGRVILPVDYPLKPPDIVMLTPSGRFQPGKKICLSNSSFHPENWQPAWSIRTVLVALRGFMPTDPKGAVGSMNLSASKRVELARISLNWKCDICESCNRDILPVIEVPEPEEEEMPILSTVDVAHDIRDELDALIEKKDRNEGLGDVPEPTAAPVPTEMPEIRQRQEPAPAVVHNHPAPVQNVVHFHREVRVVRVAPGKMNMLLGFLFSILLFLLVRKYI